MSVRLSGSFKKFEGGLKAGSGVPKIGFNNEAVGGSWFFNYGAYVQGTSSGFVFGTGDFQVDFWVNASSFSGGSYHNTLLDMRYSGGDGNFALGLSPVGQWAGTALSTGQWYHLCYSRKSGVGKYFLDGAEISSSANTANYTSDRIRIAGTYNAPNPSWQYNGYMSNWRIIKGTPIFFDNDFTVYANQSTEETGTSLLTARGNGFTDDSSSGVSLSTSGSVSESLIEVPT